MRWNRLIVVLGVFVLLYVLIALGISNLTHRQASLPHEFTAAGCRRSLPLPPRPRRCPARRLPMISPVTSIIAR